jgi:hypothetical protein
MLLGGLGKRLLGGIGKWLVMAALALALLVVLSTCIPGSRGQESTLAYSGPVEMGIAKGEFLPGTDILYAGKGEEGALVLIGGQQALKKAGDSLNWKGDLAGGVGADLKLRIVYIGEEELHAAGSAEVTVKDPAPRPASPDELAPIHYKLPVAYRVKKGAPIPGTPYLYAGKTDQGARLANLEGYPFRELGDSIGWKAQLRDGVWLDLNLRTVLMTDRTLGVAGTADLWIAPRAMARLP